MSQVFDPSAAARPQSGLFGLDCERERSAVHVLGVPFDATTSFRKGTAGGPHAILRASHQVDLFDVVTGRPYEAGIWMAPLDPQIEAWNRAATAAAQPVIDAGGVANAPECADAARKVDAIQELLNDWVEARTRAALDAEKLVALVGGDHSVSFGAIRAHADRYPGLGILQIDAHADLRPAYEGFTWSHASILHNVTTRLDDVGAVLAVGIRDLSQEELKTIRNSRDRIRAVFGHEWGAARLRGEDLRRIVRRALVPLPHEVYVTFDVDGLDPALCPNTGTPVPGGLTWDEAMLWLEELVLSGRTVVGCDLTEVAPAAPDDAGSGWDEIVGARLLYRLIGLGLQSRA